MRFTSSPGTYWRCCAKSRAKPMCGERCIPCTYPSITCLAISSILLICCNTRGSSNEAADMRAFGAREGIIRCRLFQATESTGSREPTRTTYHGRLARACCFVVAKNRISQILHRSHGQDARDTTRGYKNPQPALTVLAGVLRGGGLGSGNFLDQPIHDLVRAHAGGLRAEAGMDAVAENGVGHLDDVFGGHMHPAMKDGAGLAGQYQINAGAGAGAPLHQIIDIRL